MDINLIRVFQICNDPQRMKCSYCMDVRGLSPDCDADPMSCVDQDPNSLIYCLTINELPRQSDHIRRVVRCLSHSAFNISVDELHDAMVLRECHFDTMRHCECPNCRQSQLVSSILPPSHHPKQIFKPTSPSVLEDVSNDFNKTIIQLENSISIQQETTSQTDGIPPALLKSQAKIGDKQKSLLIKPLSLQQVTERGGRTEAVVNPSEQNSSFLTPELDELLVRIPAVTSSEKENSSQPTPLLKSLTIQRSVFSQQFVEKELNEARIENITGAFEAESPTVPHALTHIENQKTSPSGAHRWNSVRTNVVAWSILILCIFEN